MKYRDLGKTGVRVSEIGFGAWGIGGLTDGTTSYGETDDECSKAALERAFDLGITFFDTSSVYGYGRSERLVGEVFRHRRDRIVIATKGGFPDYVHQPDFSPAFLRKSLEGSLNRMGTDYVDVFQLHSPATSLLEQSSDSFECLERMKEEGLIRAWGVSVKTPADGMIAIRDHDAPMLQVNLNMMDVRARESGLLDLAMERGVGLIARTPLCFGFLSGDVREDSDFSEGDHRSGWSREQLRTWSDGAACLFDAVGVPEGQNQAQVALRYCLSYPAVSSVIPGILTPAEAEANAAASDFGPLERQSVDLVERINRERPFFCRR